MAAVVDPVGRKANWSSSSIIWYWPRGGDAFAAGKVSADLAESNGSLSLGG